eukprot:13771581-Heterocapsa_arctica.AAC.1
MEGTVFDQSGSAAEASLPPGLQMLDVRGEGGCSAAVGFKHNFEMAKHEFFESEILVCFDQRMADVEISDSEAETHGSSVWREVRK